MRVKIRNFSIGRKVTRFLDYRNFCFIYRDKKNIKEREEKGFALFCIYCDFLSRTSFFFFCFTLDVFLEQIQIFRRDLRTLCLIGGYIYKSTSYSSPGDIKYKNFRFEEFSLFFIFIIALRIRFSRRMGLSSFIENFI